MSRAWFSRICLAIGSIGLAWALAWGIGAWRYAAGLARAERVVAAGRYSEARGWLAAQAARRPGRAELEYPLGYCERALGHPEAALKAWSRIPGGTPRATQAALDSARVLIGDLGRWAEAEERLVPLTRGSGPAMVEARHMLFQLYFWQGRRDEMLRLIEEAWEKLPDRPNELRDHWRTDNAAVTFDVSKAAVAKAAERAPGDDRVWLARANLATLSGHYEEAGRWLDACLERRPEDEAVWRARLRWARAADRPDEVARAAGHLAADRFSAAERLELRAWLDRRRHDPRAEREAIEQLLAETPGDTAARERLAVLALDEGRSELAAESRRRKAQDDRDKERYLRLLEDQGVIAAFPELARLAESLGRWFEARGWWTLAAMRHPGDPEPRAGLARLARRPESTRPPRGTSLAQALGIAAARPSEGPAGRPSPGVAASLGPIPRFRDDAKAVGLRFTYHNGRTRSRHLPETTGGGVALLDYDGDGWLDVFAVQGGPFPPPEVPGRSGDRLFRNRRDGTFEDATESAGIAAMAGGYGHGVAVGDYDNDGHPDLFVTRWRSYALYRNRGDGTFEDATRAAGLAEDRDWPISAAFADLDGDGDLDLYVCHYLVWDLEHPRLCPRTEGSAPADDGSPYSYCNPNPFLALPDHLFRNDGGKFVDVSREAGIVDADGRGMGVVAADLDGDHRVDLFVANDTSANYLFRNRGGLRFEESALAAGVAANAGGGFQAGMGVACGDLDGDGLPDLAVTNFYGESTTLFRNLGSGLFADQTAESGLAAPSRYLLGFGVAMADLNNDGRLDLMTVNGHINDDRAKYPYAMPALLLLGSPGGRLVDVSADAGACWSVPRVARGLAVGDLDNDGRVDAVLVAQDGPLAYFHNRTTDGHSVTFELEGTASNRDGVGAVVTVAAGGRRRRAWRVGGGSYGSASSSRLHFGLGGLSRVDSVEVRWPSGRTDRFEAMTADRGYRLREGTKGPAPLPGPWSLRTTPGVPPPTVGRTP